MKPSKTNRAVHDPVEDRLCVALDRASRMMASAYRAALAPLDLTYPQYTVLSKLWQGEAATIKQLGDIMGADYGTMSPLIRRLEAKDLVRRARGTADERTVLVHLTSSGRKLRTAATRVQSFVSRATGLTENDQDQLVEDLRRLTRQLEAASFR